jgi:hypothetical protein
MPLDRKRFEQALADVRNEHAVTSLVFILRDKISGAPAEKASYSHSVERAQMKDQVAATFRAVLEKWLAQMAASSAEIVPFDPFSDSDAERLETISASEVPVLVQLLASIQDGQASQVAPIQEVDAKFLARLWAYAVVSSVEGRRNLYFRKFQPSRVVREDSPLGLSFRKGILSKLEAPAFNFDESADALVVGADALVLQKTLFEQIFDFAGQVYTPLAKQAIANIREIGILSDPNGLAAAIEADDNKLKKAANIGKSIDFAKLTWDNLKKIQENYGVPLLLDEENRRIVNRPADTWSILKVLNDDYLRSEMTDELYEVQSKRRVERPTVKRPAAKKPQPAGRKKTAKAPAV